MQSRGDHCVGAQAVTQVVRFVMAALLALAFIATLQASTPADYPAVVPGYQIEFPRDEGSHPQFRTEWWYVTGWLEDETGAPLGFQVTFFRTRPGFEENNPSRFAPRQLLFAHVALSDPRLHKLLHDERSARAGFGLAGAQEGALDVAIDNWSLRRKATTDGSATYEAAVNAEGLALQLEFTATQAPLLQGKEGFSQKSPDPQAASYYYSLPHLRTTGRVRAGKHEYTVRGTAWLDHEWSSVYLDPQAQGWDWVGVNLDDGGALMAFRIRDGQGKPMWAAATSRPSQRGSAVVSTLAEVEWSALRRWRSPRTGIEYPVEWKLRIAGRTLLLRPLFDDQENDARSSTGTIYWEGAVRAYDESGGPVGRGYLELTGYGGKMRL
jgi:predicted secreted hydrolase